MLVDQFYLGKGLSNRGYRSKLWKKDRETVGYISKIKTGRCLLSRENHLQNQNESDNDGQRKHNGYPPWRWYFTEVFGAWMSWGELWSHQAKSRLNCPLNYKINQANTKWLQATLGVHNSSLGGHHRSAESCSLEKLWVLIVLFGYLRLLSFKIKLN